MLDFLASRNHGESGMKRHLWDHSTLGCLILGGWDSTDEWNQQKLQYPLAFSNSLLLKPWPIELVDLWKSWFMWSFMRRFNEELFWVSCGNLAVARSGSFPRPRRFTTHGMGINGLLWDMPSEFHGCKIWQTSLTKNLILGYIRA